MAVNTFESTIKNSNDLKDYNKSKIASLRIYYDPSLDPNPDIAFTPLDLLIPITDDRIIVDSTTDATLNYQLMLECNGIDILESTKFNAFQLNSIDYEVTPPSTEDNPDPVPEMVHDILYTGTVPPSRYFYSQGDTSTLDLSILY